MICMSKKNNDKKTDKKIQKISASSAQSAMALERTRMANTRTLLAYIRSAVALFVAGAGLLKFISEIVWVYVAGVIFIIATPVLLVVGIREYFTVRKRIDMHELADWETFHCWDEDEI